MGKKDKKDKKKKRKKEKDKDREKDDSRRKKRELASQITLAKKIADKEKREIRSHNSEENTDSKSNAPNIRGRGPNKYHHQDLYNEDSDVEKYTNLKTKTGSGPTPEKDGTSDEEQPKNISPSTKLYDDLPEPKHSEPREEDLSDESTTKGKKKKKKDKKEKKKKRKKEKEKEGKKKKKKKKKKVLCV